jgi:hypothetical protein
MVAGSVPGRVGYGYTADVARLQADFGELIRQRSGEVIDDQLR